MTAFLRKYPFILIILSAFITYTSCETDYVDALYPYNEITSFSVTTDSTALEAAITEGNITLYCLYTIDLPDSVAPVITLSENASISPASGAYIPLEDGVNYTVTAQDGSTADYSLNVIINQPTPDITETDINGIYGQAISLPVSNCLLDISKTTVYFIDSRNSTETSVVVNSIVDHNGDGFGETFSISLPEEGETAIDTGYYHIKLISGVKSTTSSSAFVRVKYPAPTYDAITEAIALNPGDTLTITGDNFRAQSGYYIPVLDAIAYPEESDLTNDRNGTSLPYINHTVTSVSYKIPDDLSAGSYFGIKVGTYNDETTDTTYYSAFYNSPPNTHPQLIIGD